MKSYFNNEDTRRAATVVIEHERKSHNQYRDIMSQASSIEDRAILRDILLQKEMNELLLRNMFNL